jgi:dipeptidyl aminopeptidase/acylaminoacyl peptidase
VDLTALKTERLFQSDSRSLESVVALLGEDGSQFLTRHETVTEPLNYFVRSVGASERKPLTHFTDPMPQLRGIQKRLVTYKRADGVPLSFTLYLPPDYQPGQRLPTVVWAYPLEFNDAATAGQVSASPNRFTTISGPSHLFFLLQGYAVLDGATMPVIGDPETVNNTYIEQIVSSARAAIDKAVELGVTDRNRVGVGGHSYGAFMTANLLAHSDLFQAGIARSGAYNRTLTPFGFQSERRTLWQARDMYQKVSPFLYADRIKKPLLLIHGEADDNPGTFPIQSERLYQAIRGNGGTVRFVSLPAEAHGYQARESIEHTLYEMIAWFDRYVKNAPTTPGRDDTKGKDGRGAAGEPPRSPAPSSDSRLGIFEGQADLGTVLHPGSGQYDEQHRQYLLAGSGENMWFGRDAFHFAWKKVNGDVALAANIALVGRGTQPHRKACLMIRQSLDPDAAYVDVAVHGDGLTSLQFRAARGEATHEVQTNVASPARVQLVKRGSYALLYVAAQGQELGFSGAAVRVELNRPLFAGIGVCAHHKDEVETTRFSNVELIAPLPPSANPPVLYSTLETLALPSTDRRVVYVTPTRIEAPNWLREGKTLIYNSRGRIYRIPVTGGQPEVVDTGFATRCNNDHGVSPDGTRLVVSDQSQGDHKSRIYTLPVTGGMPQLVTAAGPSYWHGWSPDGKTLVYCGERDGEFDVYAIPVSGGQETRLTTARGLDDGPEYAPDGRHIYFNSDRTGRMQLWRMKADGTGQEQITDDDFQNWFPHPSPDGRSLVFLSYEKEVTGHPADKDVSLRRMTLADRRIDVLARFQGGQGTINVPCWSPDGRRIALVTYQRVP